MLLADVIAMWLSMADVLAIVAGVKATVFVCLWKTTCLMYYLVVADAMATLLADVIAIVVDGITTFVWADVLPNITVGTATLMKAI